MGQQSNKVIKRRRRRNYLKRQAEKAKAEAAKAEAADKDRQAKERHRYNLIFTFFFSNNYFG